MDNNWDKDSLESTELHLLDEYLSSLMDLYLAHFGDEEARKTLRN